jgi:hypothetical protein
VAGRILQRARQGSGVALAATTAVVSRSTACSGL